MEIELNSGVEMEEKSGLLESELSCEVVENKSSEDAGEVKIDVKSGLESEVCAEVLESKSSEAEFEFEEKNGSDIELRSEVLEGGEVESEEKSGFETEVNTEVLESKSTEVDFEEKCGLSLSACDDREKVGEDSEEKSDVSDGSYEFVSGIEPVTDSIEKSPLLEVSNLGSLGEEKEVEVVEFDDSKKVESDLSVEQDLGGSHEDVVVDMESVEVKMVVLEPKGTDLHNIDDDENIDEEKVDSEEEMESVKSELQQLDKPDSAEQNVDGEIKSGEQDTLDSGVVMGNNEDSQSMPIEIVESNRLETAGVVSRSGESDEDISVEEPLDCSAKEQGLELEIDSSPVDNTQLELESTDCIYQSSDGNGDLSGRSDVTDEEAKEDGDRSYVFVDGVDLVSDDSLEREPVRSVTQKEETQVYPHVIVGSFVCELDSNYVSGTKSSPGSVDNSKSEIEIRNYSIDKGENLRSCETGSTGSDTPRSVSPIDDALIGSSDKGEKLPICDNGSSGSDTPQSVRADDVLVGSEAMNDSSEFGRNESTEPAVDVYQESEGGSGSPLSNRESTNSSFADTSDEKKVDEKEQKELIRYLIKIPRYIDENIEKLIGLAHQQVDERSQNRDAIRIAIQTKKVTCNEYHDEFETAKKQERAARDAQKLKRQEMFSVQAMVNEIYNAITVEGIGDKAVQPAFDKQEELEKSLETLKKDVDSARNVVSRAEVVTNSARNKYFDENEKLRKLQAQFRSADVLRQEAYAQVQKLKKQLHDKTVCVFEVIAGKPLTVDIHLRSLKEFASTAFNKYFWMFKDDQTKAGDYGFSGDKEKLHCHCVNQVDKVRELWSKDDNFRNEYIRCNRLSTVRRLGTLDGRRLGPDEDPPILHNVRRDRVVTASPASVKANLNSPVLTLKEEKTVLPLGPEKARNSHVSTVREEKSAVNQKQNQHTAKSKDPEPFALENCSPNVSVKNEVEKETGEENVQEELERKEELLRKEAAAAIREQLLFEEKDKAKKAEEKKKRNAEKAQARAQYWERKEAELKEKEREKREKKKARKKAKKNIIEGESSVCSSESTHTLPEPAIQESENEEKPKTLSTRPFKRDTEEKQSKSVSKRPQKPSTLLKLTKTTPIPSPLRKKTKKSMRAWMWVLIGTLIVLAVVVLASRRHLLLLNSL
ncbi:hypothetical protein IFM89_031793 [Coptis chinensis]|uniref:Uncharacterized protein n=1 Tax=Coptis chinensis TaxID=261450 RepID=A0A835HR89_9MAGN|nr:hypothetical protein IFM89_031793 [Coptis chinensis]